VVRVVEKFLRDIPAKHKDRIRTSPLVYSQKIEVIEKGNNQAHVAIGRPSYALNDTKSLPFFALVNLLGGPGMNSRFNLSLREKHGLVYQIEASYTSYFDTGMFAIFFGTDPQNLNKSLRLIDKEMISLKNRPLGQIQLKTLKEQLKGQLAMSEESKQGYMLMMAKSLLDLDKVEPITKIFADIDAITNPVLADLANEMFDENELSRLIYK
jgi:predicted Zn-dependent peptidase